MVIVKNVNVCGIEAALRGMRNPLSSWNRSDSTFNDTVSMVGDKDLDLMKRLFKAGTEHRKYLRMIHAQMDITAPIYWISEFDTYKVATARNSCSFQHKGVAKEFTLSDFAMDYDISEYISGNADVPEELAPAVEFWKITLTRLNSLRSLYLATNDYKYFREIRQILPSGYLQTFTWDASYETIFTIIKQRENHKLVEWKEFIKEMKKLPLVEELLK